MLNVGGKHPEPFSAMAAAEGLRRCGYPLAGLRIALQVLRAEEQSAAQTGRALRFVVEHWAGHVIRDQEQEDLWQEVMSEQLMRENSLVVKLLLELLEDIDEEGFIYALARSITEQWRQAA